MDITAVDSIPTWEQIARFAPVAGISSLLIFFGWWLRGDTVRQLREERDWLRTLVDRTRKP